MNTPSRAVPKGGALDVSNEFERNKVVDRPNYDRRFNPDAASPFRANKDRVADGAPLFTGVRRGPQLPDMAAKLLQPEIYPKSAFPAQADFHRPSRNNSARPLDGQGDAITPRQSGTKKTNMEATQSARAYEREMFPPRQRKASPRPLAESDPIMHDLTYTTTGNHLWLAADRGRVKNSQRNVQSTRNSARDDMNFPQRTASSQRYSCKPTPRGTWLEHTEDPVQTPRPSSRASGRPERSYYDIIGTDGPRPRTGSTFSNAGTNGIRSGAGTPRSNSPVIAPWATDY